jgi:hypothetical protein
MRPEPGAVRLPSSPGKPASARADSRPSSRDVPAPPGSRSCSGARSTSPAQSCRISRSSRPFVRSGSLDRSTSRGRLAAAVLREHARAAHRPSSRSTGVARARGHALGGYLDARSHRLPRAQPRPPAGSAARRDLRTFMPGQGSSCTSQDTERPTALPLPASMPSGAGTA